MHITRIGITPLKGARHAERRQLRLETTGPVGDRVLCLLDVERDRVLRTVDHPRLVLVDAVWDGTVLSLRTPDDRRAIAPTQPTGERLTRDYWGRDAQLELLTSPHAALLSAYLGCEVRLARVAPGEVVYGGPVSLVSTGELAELAESESARFRATLTLDADRVPEPGTRLHLGDAVIRVRGAVPRCRVIDVDPATGRMNRSLLKDLAARPRRTGELGFGVDADVLVPGVVRAGDRVSPRE
ncbi:MOSC domain-containing protein [Janibacter sp. GS2]|uniref:MOSC domain-containing protein n=1 Tax=Janibacter sp. GS2 TaxID=3442646 RepID=UPI003EB9319A